MTSATGRRLSKLESALLPTEAVLAWLVEAQQFPSLVDHARSIAELPVEAAPLSVIGQRVETSVRASMKGQPFEATAKPSVWLSATAPSCSPWCSSSMARPSRSPT